jgi:hypothetical protein
MDGELEIEEQQYEADEEHETGVAFPSKLYEADRSEPDRVCRSDSDPRSRGSRSRPTRCVGQSDRIDFKKFWWESSRVSCSTSLVLLFLNLVVLNGLVLPLNLISWSRTVKLSSTVFAWMDWSTGSCHPSLLHVIILTIERLLFLVIQFVFVVAGLSCCISCHRNVTFEISWWKSWPRIPQPTQLRRCPQARCLHPVPPYDFPFAAVDGQVFSGSPELMLQSSTLLRSNMSNGRAVHSGNTRSG